MSTRLGLGLDLRLRLNPGLSPNLRLSPSPSPSPSPSQSQSLRMHVRPPAWQTDAVQFGDLRWRRLAQLKLPVDPRPPVGFAPNLIPKHSNQLPPPPAHSS